MVHKRRFVVFFFFFFFEDTVVLPPTRRLRKESAPPCRSTYFLSRVFLPPTLFFSFLEAAGASQGRSLPFLFFFFCRRTKETFLVPALKKKARRNKRAKTKSQSSSRAVREKSQRSHSLIKSLFCRFRDDDNDLLDIFFLPFSIDEEVVREEHHRRRRFEEERRR